MKIFTCTDHDAHWPVGCASVVIAEDEARARELLDAALISRGLEPGEQQPYTLTEVPFEPQAVVLADGNY